MDWQEHWQGLLLAASAASLFIGVATVLAVPWIVTRLPPEYFSRQRRETWRSEFQRPLPALVLVLVKNALGFVLALLGLVMLLTPGQGVLTLLVGLMLMNFPGKYRLERWLVQRAGVLRGLNWLRRRRGQVPFAPPASGD